MHLSFHPKDLDTGKVIDQWKAFKEKTKHLTNLLFVIPFAATSIMFSTCVIACTAVIISSIALATLGFYRSYQAGVQAGAWPTTSRLINQTQLTLILVHFNLEYEKCTKHLISLNRDNAKDFISAFFDEEKNPLVKTQSKGVCIKGTDKVFDFYSRLKTDYNNFTNKSEDSLTEEEMTKNIEIFIKAYVAKDDTELKIQFPDIK